MKWNDLEKRLLPLISNEDIENRYLFLNIEAHGHKSNISNEFFELMKERYIENFNNELDYLNPGAHADHLRFRLKEFSDSYNTLIEEYQNRFDVKPMLFFKHNVEAALKTDINNYVEPVREQSVSKTMTKEKVKELDRIEFRGEKVVLYAALKELSKEMFPDISDHRLSQLISDNFKDEDGKAIDQKTCYNQLKNEPSPSAKEKLYEVLKRISHRLK